MEGKEQRLDLGNGIAIMDYVYCTTNDKNVNKKILILSHFFTDVYEGSHHGTASYLTGPATGSDRYSHRVSTLL